MHDIYMHADTIIPFTDGSAHKVREIVDNKIQGNVFAYDETSKTFIEAPVIDWLYHDKVKSDQEFIYIKTLCPDTKNGFAAVTIAPDYLIKTRDG
ncbi:MAG: hypothetical protein IKY83_04710, partial [Proteobacteria bacterium]|nr:hypothetical protein [Pseudomonadota bacterium]